MKVNEQWCRIWLRLVSLLELVVLNFLSVFFGGYSNFKDSQRKYLITPCTFIWISVLPWWICILSSNSSFYYRDTNVKCKCNLFFKNSLKKLPVIVIGRNYSNNWQKMEFTYGGCAILKSLYHNCTGNHDFVEEWVFVNWLRLKSVISLEFVALCFFMRVQ